MSSARISVAALAFALLVTGPAGLRAQSGLEEVERLTRLGRTEEARQALLTWWEDDRGEASRRELQRGLWLRGRLTVDPVQAELDFRRLLVLYPSGQFTPDAVFRLAQASFAMGDEEGARSYVATLVRDCPRADARRDAEAWLADAGPVPPPGDTPTSGTPSVRTGDENSPAADSLAAPDPSAGDPTAATQSGQAAVGTVAAAGPEETEAGPATDPPMNYYVQLGAFAEEERAVALYEEALAAGVDVRVVRVEGSRFTHVRIGRFADRAAAVELLEELTQRGISAALVRDDRPERPIG
jgi:cell division septation protein DedD